MSAGRGWQPVRVDVSPRALARAHLPASPAWRWADLQTDDARVAALIDRLHRVRDSGLALLIQGETGTGKEVLARAIHADSVRADRPFVAVACAQLEGPALESALFGQSGAVSQACGGTLFLDEVGALSAPLQARLLQALESPREGVEASWRLVCSNRSALHAQVERGDFRDDLYYQLNGLAVTLPGLRERRDHATLTQRILTREAPGVGLALDADTLQLIERHPWPGNLRQLRQVLRAAAALAQPAATITAAHLPEGFADEARRRAAIPPQTSPDASSATAPAQSDGPVASLGRLEREAIRQALAQAGGNLSQAARQLGISRNTLYRKLRRDPGAAG
jgi:transcriptional regulator of acetoin/glycerol metabolism